MQKNCQSWTGPHQSTNGHARNRKCRLIQSSLLTASISVHQFEQDFPTQMSRLLLTNFGVCFGRRVVLSSVDLDLPPTGVDVLMGPVKTGKSTLMRSLAGLNGSTNLYRSWGTSLMDGCPINTQHKPTLVQQHASLFSSTLRDALFAHCQDCVGRSFSARDDYARDALINNNLGNLLDSLSKSVL
ncbi:hypothetical protein AcdelDRAFT_3443, partial [Acidovorax delafieldii 2AN]